MCDACDAFFGTIPIKSTRDLRLIHDRAMAAVAEEILEGLDSSAEIDFNAMSAVKQTYACTRCGQLFILEVGGCHVLGDQWRPLHGN